VEDALRVPLPDVKKSAAPDAPGAAARLFEELLNLSRAF
jgi:hypothetical protein